MTALAAIIVGIAIVGVALGLIGGLALGWAMSQVIMRIFMGGRP